MPYFARFRDDVPSISRVTAKTLLVDYFNEVFFWQGISNFLAAQCPPFVLTDFEEPIYTRDVPKVKALCVTRYPFPANPAPINSGRNSYINVSLLPMLNIKAPPSPATSQAKFPNTLPRARPLEGVQLIANFAHLKTTRVPFAISIPS